MLKKFVLVTGVMDILLGLAVSIPVLLAAKTPVCCVCRRTRFSWA